MHRVLLGSLADLLGGDFDAVGQDVADALAVGHHLQEGDERVGVAPGEFQPAGVFGRDEAFFKALDRERRRDAGGDGVKSVAVAQLVELEQVRERRHHIHQPEGGGGLVLHLVVLGAGQRAFLDAHVSAAGHRAAPAAVLTVLVGLDQHVLLVDVAAFFEVHVGAPAPVLDRAVAGIRGLTGNADGAVVNKGVVAALALVGQFLAGGDVAAASSGGGIGVEHRQGLLTAGDDGLDLLRAHHRADPGAPGGAAVVIHDAGHVGEVLAGLADHRHLGLADPTVTAVFLLQGFFGLVGVLAPEVAGVLQAGLAVVEQQVDGLVGNAGEDDTVVTGGLQCGAEGAAAVGVAPAAGERRLAANHEAVALDAGAAGERAGEDSQQILRPQRVGAGRHALVEQPRGDAVAPHVVAQNVVSDDLVGQGPAAKIHVQDPAHITVGHRPTSCGRATARIRYLPSCCRFPRPRRAFSL